MRNQRDLQSAASAYHTCLKTASKSLGPALAEDACAHLKAALLRSVAREKCPREAEAVESLCGGLHEGVGNGRACAIAAATLDACLGEEARTRGIPRE